PDRLAMERDPALTLRVEMSSDQSIANNIPHLLQQSGQLHNYRIDINVHHGAADLIGSVVDQLQREEALRLVQGVPGVDLVRDHLTLSGPIAQVLGQATVEQAPPPRRVPGAVAAVPGAEP